MAHAKWQDIVDAFEFVSSARPMEHEAYVSRETGVVYWHSEMSDDIEPLPDDIDDEEKYVAIPHKNDLDLGTRLVFRFVDQHLPQDSARAREIFSRLGAYARFKDLLQQRHMLDHWYEFEAAAQTKALREWCEMERFEIKR